MDRGAQHTAYFPARRKEKLVALDEMWCFISGCFFQESGTRCLKGWQLCVGISDCSWHSGEGQHRSQSTGPVSCLQEQPPKMFCAELSTGCGFQMQLVQGALHLALWKVMKAGSKRMTDVSQRGGYNHLPWTGYSGVLGEYWNLVPPWGLEGMSKFQTCQALSVVSLEAGSALRLHRHWFRFFFPVGTLASQYRENVQCCCCCCMCPMNREYCFPILSFIMKCSEWDWSDTVNLSLLFIMFDTKNT